MVRPLRSQVPDAGYRMMNRRGRGEGRDTRHALYGRRCVGMNKRVLGIGLFIWISFGIFQPAGAGPLRFKAENSISRYSTISGYGRNADCEALKRISGTIDQEVVENRVDSGLFVRIDGLGLHIEPRLPIIPYKSIRVELPGHYDIEDVFLDGGMVRSGKTTGKILAGSKSRRWKNLLVSDMAMRREDPAVYEDPLYFPGKWLSFVAGYDGKSTHVFIRLYPVQWIPVGFDLAFLSEYSIVICGRRHPETSRELGSTAATNHISATVANSLTTKATHIILSTDAWSEMAEKIKAFNEAQNPGITAAVISTDSIYANYDPAENPIEPGYRNKESNPKILNYEFENAKRIISYLRDHAAHPNLKSITILGSGKIIPPSYYFHYQEMPDDAYDYDDWKPSDQYYSSPDYDWVDNYSLSRISVKELDDLSTYYNKMVSWNRELHESWIRNASVAGGRPFDTVYYIGEMMNNQVIRNDLFQGFSIKKFQRTLGNLTLKNIEDYLRAGGFLLHYHVDHGSGNGIDFASGEELTGEDLLDFSPNGKVPVFVTVACMDGAFDTDLYKGFEGMAFSEGMLASKGAGIAYVGGARSNEGNPEFVFDNGNLRYIGVTYLAALIEYYFKAYRETSSPTLLTLGNLFKQAKKTYLAEQGMDTQDDKGTYVQSVSLGDAALLLPNPPARASATTLPKIALSDGWTNRFTNFQIVNLSVDKNPKYVLSDENEYSVLSVNITNREETTRLSSITNDFELDNLKGDQLILNKVITGESKEAWHYSIVNKGEKRIDGYLSDWIDREVVGTSPKGNIIPPSFDLTAVYASNREDDENLYNAVPVNLNPTEDTLYYILAIDDEPFGFRNNITLPDPFPLNIYLGFEKAEINKLVVLEVSVSNSSISEGPEYYEMPAAGEDWDEPKQLNAFGGLSCVTDDLIEIALPKDWLNLDNLKMLFFTSTIGGVIEDVVPSSPDSPHTVVYGKENAYSVSAYIPGTDIPSENLQSGAGSGGCFMTSATH
ncbi:MAG: hypothetical protein JRL30_17140 [Deltaproteobacteria bacterium]|nr:hypothetical protein [Deltaproteobacteria bacterium]